jgi:2-aminobenzoylacetyl-CoA thioesterase
MIRESAGKITEGLYALGNAALPAYLLSGKTPVLFDAGMTFMGPVYLRDLAEYLGDASRLAYLFLTHSHFDHSGAAPFLKRNIPALKICAGKIAAEIFTRQGAIQLIQSLSKGMEEANRSVIGDADVAFRGLELDRPLEDGEEIVLEEGTRIRVIATPGHTRDAVSYYLPGIKALVCGEAVGTLDRKMDVRSVFLSSYQDYLASLEKLRDLEIELLLMGHAHVLTEEDARGIVARVIETTLAFRARIERELEFSGGNQDAAVKKIFREDYVEKKLISQDQRPFLINLAAQVKAIAERK